MYGGLTAGLSILFLALIIKMREDWRAVTEKTIRSTAASYSVKFTNLPNPLPCRKFAEWLGKNYGPIVSICVVNRHGNATSGICTECAEYVNNVYYFNIPKEQAIDPLRVGSDLFIGDNPKQQQQNQQNQQNENDVTRVRKLSKATMIDHRHEFYNPKLVIVTFLHAPDADRF